MNHFETHFWMAIIFGTLCLSMSLVCKTVGESDVEIGGGGGGGPICGCFVSYCVVWFLKTRYPYLTCWMDVAVIRQKNISTQYLHPQYHHWACTRNAIIPSLIKSHPRLAVNVWCRHILIERVQYGHPKRAIAIEPNVAHQLSKSRESHTACHEFLVWNFKGKVNHGVHLMP